MTESNNPQDQSTDLSPFNRSSSIVTSPDSSLPASEELYSNLFKNAVEGICYTTAEGLMLKANPAYARMYGYDEPEKMCQNINDIGSQLYVNAHDRIIFKNMLLENGQVIGFETQHKKKSGDIFWISITARSVTDNDGNIIYYENFCSDITKRKNTEQELQDSNEMHHLLMEALPIPVTVYDKKGNVTYINPAFTDTYGWVSEEVKGGRLDFVPKHEEEKTKDAVLQTLNGERVFLETQRYTKNKNVLDVQLYSALVKDRTGKAKGMFVLSRDITKIKKAEKELEKYRGHLEQLVEERTSALKKSEEQYRSRRFVLVPLKVGDRTIGVVMADNKVSKRPINPSTIEPFALLCQQLATALEAADLYAETRKLEKEATFFYEVTTLLASNLDMDHILELITRKTTDLLGCDGSTILKYDETEDLLRVHRSHNLITDTKQVSLKPGEGISGQAFKFKCPMWVEDRLADSSYKVKSPSGSKFIDKIGNAWYFISSNNSPE